MADEQRPEGLETKDTRGTLLGYITAEVPHVSRTGYELSDKEREESWKSIGTPHAAHFDDSVSSLEVGEASDSENARRVGEGHYPAESPAAPKDEKKSKQSSDAQQSRGTESAASTEQPAAAARRNSSK